MMDYSGLTNDILGVVGSEDLGLMLDLPGACRTCELEHVLRGKALPELRSWLREIMGWTQVVEVLRALGEPPARGIPIDSLIETWLDLRGFWTPCPRARPLRLARGLRTKALQSATVGNRWLFATGHSSDLERLLRWLVYYYLQSFAEEDRLPFIQRAVREHVSAEFRTDLSDGIGWIDALTSVSASELAVVAVELDRCLEAPYEQRNEGQRVVRVLDERMRGLLRKAARARNRLQHGRGGDVEVGEFIAAFTDLLEVWSSEGVLPRGAVLLEPRAFAGRFDLRGVDEHGLESTAEAASPGLLAQLVAEDGAPIPLSVFLVPDIECSCVGARGLEPLPVGAPWNDPGWLRSMAV